jgi:starch phosphorylase
MPGTRFTLEVQPLLPERFRRLEELASDLFYSWDRGVRTLFHRLDQDLWEACGHNPKVFLRRIAQDKLEAAARDMVFLEDYNRVLSGYDTYKNERVHARVERILNPEADLVAYFSAEYGFHESFPIYAGGLGILTGDYCKAISDLGLPFVAVGLLYRQGYFSQVIDCHGEQIAAYPYVHSADLPVTAARDDSNEEVVVHVDMPGRRVNLKVWQARAGHITLYLLDSDVPSNREVDRSITLQLYGGDSETRIQQELCLGIGGLRALRALGLKPTVWHMNEGHASFLILERCRELVEDGMDFDSAFELVAADTVFTTHTPVPAGHDIFDHGLIRTYFGDFLREVGISEARFFALGASAGYRHGFNMTALALRGSRFHNGVSRIHGRVASEMEAFIWPEVPPDENPIGYVTNGIHVPTFLGRAWVALFDMYFGTGWRNKLDDEQFWEQHIDSIPDHVYLSTHQVLKAEMIEDARRRAIVQLRRNGCSESHIRRITRHLSPNQLDSLVIGFARRFATYKRATLLFSDLPRLARVLTDPQRPVLFVFAGKAHPNDRPGQQLIREIADIAMRPEFEGRIILLEDYNLSMARKLLPGVDVWLNNPEYPLEACGTSGMKAGINGVINFSVLDGWWGEGYNGDNGWAITPHASGLDPETRNREEALELLDILEHHIVPLYFARTGQGEPQGWIRKSKASMKSIMPRFNAQRMAMDYIRDYYGPASRQRTRLMQNARAPALELASWKRRTAESWPGVRIRMVSAPSPQVKHGHSVPIEVAVYLNGLEPEDVVVECVLGRENELGEFIPSNSLEFTAAGPTLEGETLFRLDLCAPERGIPLPGLQSYKIRIFPYHPLLSHRFECGCMRWL